MFGRLPRLKVKPENEVVTVSPEILGQDRFTGCEVIEPNPSDATMVIALEFPYVRKYPPQELSVVSIVPPVEDVA